MNNRTINNTNYGFDKNNMYLSIRDINILVPCYHISMTNKTSKASAFWIYLYIKIMCTTKVGQEANIECVQHYEKMIFDFQGTMSPISKSF